MPLTIPPFAAYQAALIPVASRWSLAPPEGSKMIPAEIDWGVTVGVGLAVQFALNAGPVEFTQVVAFSVDNSRCGADVSFIMPDTGKQLTVPATAQGVYPVFTNSLTFYASAPGSNVGDVTVLVILNSMPPPVSVLPSEEQTSAAVAGINLLTAGTTQLIPAGVTGTLQGASLMFTNGGAAAFVAGVSLRDGTGAILWTWAMTIAANSTTTVPLSALKMRFYNGLQFLIASPSGTGPAAATINLYYSVP